MSTTHKTFCRNCMSMCGIEVEIEGDRVIDVRGDKDNAVSQGYFCIKGSYTQDQHNGEDRLKAPALHREGGEHKEVPINNALDDIAEQLSALKDSYGPRSIALFYGTGTAYGGLSYIMAKAWMSALGSPELYSTMTIDQSAKWVTSGRMGGFATGKPLITDTDVVILSGANVVVSHMGMPLHSVPASGAGKWLAKAKKQGTKIIVIDPRRTETAKRADLFLQVKPGEDPALLAAMIKLILDENLHNQGFCDRFVESLEQLHEAVKDITPEYASQRTGVPATKIVEAARLFATAKRKTAGSGTGPDMNANSNLSAHLLEALNAICGGYRLAGDPLRSQGALFATTSDVEKAYAPNRTWESGPKMRSVDSGQLFGEFPTSRLPDEILHEGEDRIRALICFGSNPATAIADNYKTLMALKSLELLVVIDPRMSESGKLAHYIIPTKLPYERSDMIITGDSWFHINHAQYTKAIVSGPEGMLEDWQVMWELGSRMKLPMVLKSGAYGLPFDALPPGFDIDMEKRPSTDEMLALMCRHTRVDFKELQASPSGITLDETVVKKAPESEPGKTMARMNLCADDVFAEIRDYYCNPETPSEYAYQLTCRRVFNTVNSYFSRASKVKQLYPETPIFMHPDDMVKEGIEDRQAIELQSPYGKVGGVIRRDPSMNSGVLSMPHGWGELEPTEGLTSVSGNLVSLDKELQPINFMPRQSGIPVKVLANETV